MVGSGTGSEIIGGHSQSRPEMAKEYQLYMQKSLRKIEDSQKIKEIQH